MASESENQILYKDILDEFKDVFNKLDIKNTDVKREYRFLGKANITAFERDKLGSIEGYSFNKEDAAKLLVSNPFGHIVYKDRPVLLYIRDQELSKEKYENGKFGPFHICNCNAIEAARKQNRFVGRYVITFNTSGVFSINVRVVDGYGNSKYVVEREKGKTVKLRVCQECLRKIGWKGFNKYIGEGEEWWEGGDWRARERIVKNFSIEEYLRECENNLFDYEDYSDLDYASNAVRKQRTLDSKIKLWLKESTGCRCEKCFQVFPKDKLQIHHIDHNEGNNRRNNLLVICDTCHNNLHIEEDFWSNAYVTDSMQGNGYALDNLQKRERVLETDNHELNLANSYYNGINAIRDIDKAVKIYRKLGNEGNAEAQFMMGMCYLKGEGTIKSQKEAVEWFNKAANNGHDEALYQLGLIRFNAGKEKEAFVCFKNAAAQGNLNAQFELTRCNGGEITHVNGNVDIELLKKMALQGSPQAQYELALDFANKRDYGSAHEWLETAANQGHVMAQYKLGEYYSRILANYELANYWFEKASDNNYAPAQYAMAKAYYSGLGVSVDQTAALLLAESAAAQNYEPARTFLSNLYKWYSNEEEKPLPNKKREDIHVIKRGSNLNADELYKQAKRKKDYGSYEEAFEYFLMAAEKGHVDAQYEVARAYDDGIGVKKSKIEAGKWYKLVTENWNKQEVD